jgi:ABC-2 type transport system permease protein
MTRLIKTELRKLATVRTFKGIVVGAAVFTLVWFAMVVVNAGKIEAAPLGTGASTRDLMNSAGTGAILFLVLGILAVSTEIRHGTIGWTFLATPNRWRVMAAKVSAVLMVSAVYAIAISVLVIGLIALLFAQKGIPFDTINSELVAAMAGAVVGVPLYGILGVGMGALIHNQVAALLIPLAYLLVVETLLPSFGLMPLMVWLPGGASASLARADLPGLLPMWGGGLLMAAYAAAAVAAGGRALAGRDVT